MDKPAPWEEVWINIALELSRRSKDPKTKVGCILVSPDNRRLFVGYNGFPEGFEETPERWSRPTKYKFCIHAEQNALDHRTCDVGEWTCYTTCRPCEDCALRLVNARIKKVIYLGEAFNANYELAAAILREGKVEEIKYYQKKDIYDKNILSRRGI